MKKPYLLIAGDDHYPLSGVGDWVDFFETQEEAENYVVKEPHPVYYTGGKNKGEIMWTINYYKIPSDEWAEGYRYVDWYDIIDLRAWTEND